MEAGNTVYFLSEYNWERGTFIKKGKSNIKIKDWSGSELAIKNEKVAGSDELVCVVWEKWKGRNGRGAYRVERNLYPNLRIPASKVARQGLSESGRVIEEESYGVGRYWNKQTKAWENC